MLEVASRIGSGLLRRGHRKGDRLAIILDNRPEYILAWMGAAMAGIAEVPVNTAYRGTFLAHQIATVAPSAVVLSSDVVERILELGDAGSSIDKVYVVGDLSADDVDRLKEIGIGAEEFSVLLRADPEPLPAVDAKDLASVFFTSGTTGLSKGVTMSHRHMVFEADECISLTRLTDADTYMSVGPLFHGNAQFLAAYPALLAGARFVLHPRFSATRWSSWVRESGATVTNFVGVMMEFVWKQPPRPDDADNDLRCIFAAPTASSIVDGFKQRFGVETFVEVFGLTETSMPIMTLYGAPRPPGAAGVAVADWFDIQLVDPETDDEVPIGEVGELLVRPKRPFIMTNGYFGMPDRTAEAMRNYWFHTGDGLRRDAEGWYYFVDRLKDSLRRRGENISSYELEQAISKHEQVAECAVVAVPADVEGGEDEVMAVVVTRDRQALDPAEFWVFCDRSLPYFTVPRYIRFVSALPKTPSEKVRKGELRAVGVGEDTFDRLKVLGRMPERS
jgi:crotonobetaine/carnitine-CoA ligase